MSILAGGAAVLHVMESLYTFYLTRFRLNMKPATVALWTINNLIAGTFGLWILLFPRAFLSISRVYCRIPASFCYNVHV
jgi:H+/gluconate symporter-like permease